MTTQTKSNEELGVFSCSFSLFQISDCIYLWGPPACITDRREIEYTQSQNSKAGYSRELSTSLSRVSKSICWFCWLFCFLMRIEQDLTELVEFLIQGPKRRTHQFHVVFCEILFLSSPEFGPRKRTISALEPQSPNASFLSKPSIQISSKTAGKLPTRLLMTYPNRKPPFLRIGITFLANSVTKDPWDRRKTKPYNTVSSLQSFVYWRVRFVDIFILTGISFIIPDPSIIHHPSFLCLLSTTCHASICHIVRYLLTPNYLPPMSGLFSWPLSCVVLTGPHRTGTAIYVNK